MTIYNKSNEDLEPICPSIVFSGLYDIDDDNIAVKNQKFIEIVENNIFSSKKYENIFNNDNKSNNARIKIGVIAMEYSCNGKTVSSEVRRLDEKIYEINNEIKRLFNINDTINQNIHFRKYTDKQIENFNKQVVENYGLIANLSKINKENTKKKTDILLLSIFEHYRLYKLGYFHGDFHLANALFCDNYNYICDNNICDYNFRVMLIDFGLSFKFSETPKDYSLFDFCNIILGKPEPNGFDNRNHPPYFKWINYLQNIYREQKGESERNNDASLQYLELSFKNIIDKMKIEEPGEPVSSENINEYYDKYDNFLTDEPESQKPESQKPESQKPEYRIQTRVINNIETRSDTKKFIKEKIKNNERNMITRSMVANNKRNLEASRDNKFPKKKRKGGSTKERQNIIDVFITQERERQREIISNLVKQIEEYKTDQSTNESNKHVLPLGVSIDSIKNKGGAAAAVIMKPKCKTVSNESRRKCSFRRRHTYKKRSM